MADQDQIYDAIRKADAAGDAEAVRKLAAYLETTQAAPAHTYQTRDRQGRKVQFEGPADASDDEVRQLAAKATGEDRLYRGSRIERSGAPLAPPEQTAGRALGIGTRDVIEGALSVPDLVAAPLNSLINLTGTNLSTTPFRDLGRRAADAIGLPVAETGQERTLSAIAQGGASALVPAAAATGLVARGGGAIAANLAYKPGAQVVAGGVAGGSADVARDMGAGPVGQAVAGLAGGVVAPVAMTGASQTVRSLASLATREGALDTAARTLQSLAVNPAQAASRIRYAPEQVSGAQPTLGELSRDAGLAGLQRGQANTNPVAAAQIGERMQLNAIARTDTVGRALGPGSPQRLQDVGASRLAAAQGDTAAQQALAREALETRLVGTRQQALTEAQAARARVGEVAGTIGPVADRAASGVAARDRFGEAYQAAKARTRAAYNDPRLVDDEPVQLRPLELRDIYSPGARAPQEPDIAGFQQEAVNAVKGRIPKQPESLLQFVRRRGGVLAGTSEAGDLRHSGLDARGAPTLVNRNGRPMDELREAAEEAGFIPQGTTLSEFTEMLADEQRGLSRLVRPDDMAAVDDRAAAEANRDFWRREFDDAGLDPLNMTDAQWRSFHERMRGSEASTTRTLDDMDTEATNSRLMGPFQQTLASLRDRFFGDGGAEAPAYMRSFFNDVLDADMVGIKTLEGWERRALDMAAKAPDRTTGAFMQSVARAIGAKASVEAGPGRRGALEAARGVRREQGRVYETGGASAAFRRDRYGNPVTGDTALPTQLVRPGAAGGDTADGLIAAVGPEAAEQTAREEMRRLADGVETGTQAASLIQRHAEMLSRFPTLRADMDRWAATTNDADQAAAAARIAPRATPEETAALSAVSPAERELTGTPLARLADPRVEPSAEVARLLARSDGGRELKRLTSQIRNDPEAMDGARRAMAEYVETTGRGPNLTAAGDAVPSPNPTRRAIETVLKRGGALLNDQQRIVLQKVARELEGVNFASSAGRPAGSETAMNASVSTLIGKQIMGAATGKASMLLTKALSLLGNGEQVQRFITDAILDPSFAADLLRRQTPDRVRALIDRLRVSAQGSAIGGMSTDRTR